jgi:hypothetical protein
VKTNQRHSWPTVKGIKLCANHRPSGPGPLTEEGKAKCAAAKTIQGPETLQKQAHRSTKMAELCEREMLGRELGLISGPKTADESQTVKMPCLSFLVEYFYLNLWMASYGIRYYVFTQQIKTLLQRTFCSRLFHIYNLSQSQFSYFP